MLSNKLSTKTIRQLNSIHSRSICHKSKLIQSRNNYHWPYERRSWGFTNFFLDWDTYGKFNENTKIIQVEGNISAGKEEFAKNLAEELGMFYLPRPNLNDFYKNKHGFDYMALNVLLPERLRYCDWNMFHENPSRHSVIHMQHFLFRMRVFEYYRALRHLFNTGQGVVMTRTCFTERAIVEAMDTLGWLPKGYLREDGVKFYDWKTRYIFLRNLVLADTFTPHLTIYLDTPVDTCLRRIQNDPNPNFANSKAHCREFLESIETSFKDIVLPKQDYNMAILMVDHPEHKSKDEIIDVIDDIEKINFEFDVHDTRYRSWYAGEHSAWYFDNRRRFTTLEFASRVNKLMHYEWYDIAGLGDSISHSDLCLRQALFEGHVGPVGFTQTYDTDRSIHGLVTSILGKYFDYSERVASYAKKDFA